jgi:Heterokaryon incompatibility protein (HET)
MAASSLEREGKLFERALLYSKFWLYRCVKVHSKCRQIVPFSETLWPALPKRVVDVSQVHNGNVKLVNGSPRRSPYCTLSYRWGHPTVKTTKDSIASFRDRISVDSLQTEMKDAFIIAHGLGIQFVWVDALVSDYEPATYSLLHGI